MAKHIAASIRAAGGVVWRASPAGVEVALVHRPRYDDWSLPKGKFEAGESGLAAAVREVHEELGSRVAVSRFVQRVEYPTSAGDKRVDFWAMRHVGGGFEANAEVDAVRWLAVAQARDALSYGVERDVLDRFAGAPLPDAVIVLVRHAKAGKRSEWEGDDLARPLDASGRRQAKRLVAFLDRFAPDALVSAEPVRCVQTVEPFAAHAGLDLVIDPVFGDEAFVADPAPTLDAVSALTRPGRVTVVASQGDTIPGVVEYLSPSTELRPTRKGAAWVLSFADGDVLAADYYGRAAR